MANYWLMKTEPDGFSIDDLERVKSEPWSGVRNFTARNFMRDDMQVGDTVLFYHSSCPVPGIYGLAKVSSEAEVDQTQFDPKSDYYDARAKKDKPIWYCVRVAYVSTLEKPVTLAMLRANPKLKTMITLEPGSRLSITPVTEKEYEEIQKMIK